MRGKAASKKFSRASNGGLKYWVSDADESAPRDELAEAEIPDYLRRRRREFDEEGKPEGGGVEASA